MQYTTLTNLKLKNIVIYISIYHHKKFQYKHKLNFIMTLLIYISQF